MIPFLNQVEAGQQKQPTGKNKEATNRIRHLLQLMRMKQHMLIHRSLSVRMNITARELRSKK